MRPVEHHLEQATLAANRFQCSLTSHFKLALDPWCEEFQQGVGVFRCGRCQGGIDAALKCYLLDTVAMLEAKRQ